jgi:hypothetical protein
MSDPSVKKAVPGEPQVINQDAGFQCGAAINTETMERFVSEFQRSARRWEIVVYPGLFAFVVLAAYGFYLVYSLTSDMRQVAQSVNNMNSTMNLVYARMDTMNTSMSNMTNTMDVMSDRLTNMTDTIGVMSTELETLEPMLGRMASLDNTIKTISVPIQHMRNDMSHMTYTMGRPMNFMNRFMPW